MKTSFTATELAAQEFAEREYFMRPLLAPGFIGMLYAPPGVGKTLFALWLAVAVSSRGSFLKWSGHIPGNVFYADGEMSSPNISKRMDQIALSANFKIIGDKISFTCPDVHPDYSIPYISEEAGQEWYEAEFAKRETKIFIVDNLLTSTITRKGEAEIDTWFRVQKWLVRLRARGMAVVLVHHAGKGGSQLGSMQKEVILNWIISLKRPSDYQAVEGARFEVHFQKGRDFVGEDSEPLHVVMRDTGDSVSWDWKPLLSRKNELVLEMTAEGLKPHQIVKETGMGLFQVRKILNEGARADGPKQRDSDANGKTIERGFCERETPLRTFSGEQEPF